MSENEKAANSGKKECSADQADYAIDQVEHQEETAEEVEQNADFYILTPTILNPEEYALYEPAITQALNNNDVRNIAITGGYGAGKSSVIETAKKENKDLKWVDISLAHFQSESKRANKGFATNNTESINNKSYSNNESNIENSGVANTASVNKTNLTFSPTEEDIIFNAEAALLNQLIFQVNSKDIPQSRFKRTVPEDKRQVHTKAVFTVAFILSFLFLVYFMFLRLDLQNAGAAQVDSIASFLTSDFLAWGLATIAFIVVITGLYFFVSNQLKTKSFSRVLHKLKVFNTEIELFEESRSSPLEEYADDVVYVLLNSNIDVVVFEDLDRFDSIGIFEHLRAINTLVNSSKEGRDKPVKFFYLIRDSLFNDASERTKFFDLIIPVIPFVDTESSFSELSKALEGFGIFPDETFLYQLSLFIYDPRALFEIANEANQLKRCMLGYKGEVTRLDDVKIVSLAAYKVAFPQDFEKMYSRNSIIDILLDMRDEYASFLNQDLNAKLERINAEIETLNNLMQVSDENIDLLYMLPSYNELQDRFSQEGVAIESTDTLEAFKDQFKSNEALASILGEHLENIEDPNYKKDKEPSKAKIVAKIENLENQKSNLEDKVAQAQIQELSALLQTSNNVEKFYQLPFESGFKAAKIGEDWVESYSEAYKSPNFDLIRFLITGGYIDNSRYRYISKYRKGGMSFEDREYLAALIQNRECDPAQEIVNPKLFLARITHVDLAKRGSRNFSLLSYLIAEKRTREIECVFQGINSEEDHSFLVEYICSKTFNSDIFLYIDDFLHYSFADVISNKSFGVTKLRLVCQKIVFTAPDSFIFSNRIYNAVLHFASGDPDFLCLDSSLKAYEKSMFCRIPYQFSDINIAASDPDLVKKVYEENLYIPNLCLVKKLLVFCGDISEDVSMQELIAYLALSLESPVVKRIESNSDIFIGSLAESMAEEKTLTFQEDKPVVWMLNLPGLSPEIARKIIMHLSGPAVNRISSLDNPNIITMLFDEDLIENAAENIFRYFNLNDNDEIDDVLANYINEHDIPADFGYKKMRQIVGDKPFISAVVRCLTLDNGKVCKIISGMGRIYNDFSFVGIPINRVKCLINSGVITPTQKNLVKLRENYCPEGNLDVVVAFALKYPKGYLRIVVDGKDNALFSEDEALELLKNKSINFNNQIKLLKGFTGYIAANTQYRDSVNEKIIRFYCDPNEIQELTNIYDLLGEKSKKAILGLLCDYVVNDTLRNLSLNRPCLDDLIKAYSWTKDQLACIVESQLTGLNSSVYKRSDVSELFDIAEMDDFCMLLNGKHMSIRFTPQNQQLIEALKNRGFCGKYREKADGMFLYVYPRT